MLRSISDDDLCADCTQCTYDPGNLSGCKLDWPGKSNEDGYIVTCVSFAPVAEAGDNFVPEAS